MQNLNTRLNTLRNTPRFHGDLDLKNILEFIKKHEIYKIRYQLLHDYFVGKHSILTREIAKSKPNNQIIDNFAEYIVNVKAGFLVGKPISYIVQNTEKKKAFEEVQFLLDYNDAQDLENEIAKLVSVFGHAFELAYLDKNGLIRLKEISPLNMFVIYEIDLEDSIKAAVRYNIMHTERGEEIKAEVYLTDRIQFLEGNRNELRIVSEKAHAFKDVPVIEYVNNSNKLSDFENVISLIDAYELVLADAVNEIQYFSESYLVIKNLLQTEDTDLEDMKNNRVISIGDDGETYFLTKEINDTHIQNTLDRLQRDIHRASNTPNLTDENFAGNLSGVAMKFKLWGLEQDIQNKERKMKKGLQRRFELMLNALNTLKKLNLNWTDIKIIFTRNFPANDLETADLINKLQGQLPQETLLSLLSFVEDAAAELEILDKEEKKSLVNYGFKEGV